MSASVHATALSDRAAEFAEPIDIAQYRTIFRRHPAGVAVIALNHGGHPVGFTATSIISVSAAPPLLAFSLHPLHGRLFKRPRHWQ